MGTINSSDRIAATLYSLGTWFVRNMCIKTLHKGDSDDNNNNNTDNLFILFMVFEIIYYGAFVLTIFR
jgi:hypothetical protein